MSKDMAEGEEVTTPGGPAKIMKREKPGFYRVAFTDHGGEGIYADDVVMPKRSPIKTAETQAKTERDHVTNQSTK